MDLAKLEELTEEFYDYQLLKNEEIPKQLMKSFHTDKGCLKLDALWQHLGEMKDVAERFPKGFPRLRLGMRLILTILHCNAVFYKRAFSIARKNKICFRPNLDPEETLASIV